MFDAYPRQRISYSKVAIPLSLVALLCLVLYAVFESGEDARPDSEDPNMKRMRPFLSSQSFEIGLWTRQKGPSASASASGRSSSPEVEELRQELEKARVRTEKQAAELSKLRGSMSAGSKEDDEAVHGEEAPPAPVTKTAPASAAAEIPESLWREAPSTSRAPEETPKTEKEPKESEAVKDSTITVKTGDKEISIQIGKELSTSSTSLQMRGAEQIGDGDSDVSTTQAGMATSLRANATDAKIRGEGDGTLITVRSGQQSIVIQVRDGEQVTTSSPTTTDSSNTTLLENPLKALPDVPELPPEPKAEEPMMDVEPKGDKVEIPPKTESEASTTKGFSAYANLALRTR